MSAAAEIRMFLSEPISKEVKAALARLSRAPDVRQIAIMPDVHLAENICVGTVFATSRVVYPQAVGGDIGCGMLAAALDISAADVDWRSRGHELLVAIGKAVPMIRHRSGAHADVDTSELSDSQLAKAVLREATLEVGTLGRGNHFIELQRDDNDRLWVMIHSGSRAAGQLVMAWHMRRATKFKHNLHYLDTSEDAGKAYLNDAQWAENFAALNRAHMLCAAVSVIRNVCRTEIDAGSIINCSHNHVHLEKHGGETLLVHRKGANNAATDVAGIIPGSMGTESYHVRGKGDVGSICSSSHGAGRKMSRTEAATRISRRELVRQMGDRIFNVDRAGQLREEAPDAYRDIRKVMAAQRDLVAITRRLTPILNFKGA